MSGKATGINIFNQFRIGWFKYIYMLVMVVYMGQMTAETSRMVGTLSGNPIPFLIPIVLTFFLVTQYRINWKCKRLWALLGILFVWAILVLVKLHSITSTAEWSFMFFLFYAVIIAFIHVRVYGRQLFPVYEHVMVQLSKLSLVLWVLNIIFFNHPGLMSFFPETPGGNSIAYLYHWQTIDKIRSDGILITLRNSGCAWESGRYAIMLTLAIFSNLSRRGISFKNNSSVLWLLAALISTQSTTGYVITLVLFAMFSLMKFSARNLVIFVMLIAPAIYLSFSLDFMGSKIESQMDIDETSLQSDFGYSASLSGSSEYLGSLSRFESMYFEWQNISNDHWLGYGRNPEHSYFNNNISSNYVLAGGLLQIFGQYGVILGLLLYFLLFYSSHRIASKSKAGLRIALSVVIILTSVSYITWTVPVFSAFWLYGIFAEEPKKKYRAIINVGNETK